MPKPPKFKAAEVITAINEALGVVRHAAERLECSPVTVYAYIERYPTVKAALHANRRSLVAEAQSKMVDMMRDSTHRSHYKAVHRVLLAYDTETDWSDRRQVTGQKGQPLQLTWAEDIKVVGFSTDE